MLPFVWVVSGGYASEVKSPNLAPINGKSRAVNKPSMGRGVEESCSQRNGCFPLLDFSFRIGDRNCVLAIAVINGSNKAPIRFWIVSVESLDLGEKNDMILSRM